MIISNMIVTQYDCVKNLGVSKIFLNSKKKSGGNQNTGIPFIFGSLIEKQRNIKKPFKIKILLVNDGI